MKRNYKTDEIQEYINRLNKISKGISSLDQQHLTALIMQATPHYEIPSLDDLDIHNGLPIMIASYIANPNTDTAFMLADYIKNLYMDFFKETIKSLVESNHE